VLRFGTRRDRGKHEAFGRAERDLGGFHAATIAAMHNTQGGLQPMSAEGTAPPLLRHPKILPLSILGELYFLLAWKRASR
jgi:hypothetical protein